MALTIVQHPKTSLYTWESTSLKATLDETTTETHKSDYIYCVLSLGGEDGQARASDWVGFGDGQAALQGDVVDGQFVFAFDNLSLRRAGRYRIRVTALRGGTEPHEKLGEEVTGGIVVVEEQRTNGFH